jgi:hypothetical protein
MTTIETVALPQAPSRSQAALCVALYCATAFTSALLLFCLEPLFSKMVLPVLGGSSSVWSVAMVVFQALLLAGYVYAWLITSYLTLKQAMLTHLLLLVAASLCLPIAIASGFGTPPGSYVSLWLIGLFAASIGLPFFAVAANAPLLQAWFARTTHDDAANPYFLYRASNLGSFAVLLAYPFLIEPVWGLAAQSRLWTMGYAALCLAIAFCGVLALSMTGSERAVAISRSRIAWNDRLQWVVLGFVPSGLLVAVTAHISTDVASAPFLWIAPLAIYLLTFVLAFTDKPLIRFEWLTALQPLSIAVLGLLFLWDPVLSWAVSIPGHLIGFFLAAMVCHTLVFRRRPAAENLTQFYAWLSAGGVLGGMFAALLAPQIFDTVLEYPLLVLAAFALRPDVRATPRGVWQRETIFVAVLTAALAAVFFFLNARDHAAGLRFYGTSVVAIAVLLPFMARQPVRVLGFALALFLITNAYPPGQDIIYRARSFFGVYKVLDKDGGYRLLFHGTTTHGAERIAGATPPEPLAYYFRGGALGQAVEAVRASDGAQFHRAALVGLGIGALSCYARPGEAWTFYELDPLVVKIARDRDLFRSFSACGGSAPVVIGDARLTLRTAQPGYDLLILDAFTSDSVPVHLLTQEAFALYKSKLSPHGVIVFHISNRNLELANVVAASAAANGMVAELHPSLPGETRPFHFAAEVAVVARSPRDLAALKLGPPWHPLAPRPGVRVWSDDYSNVLAALLERMAN